LKFPAERTTVTRSCSPWFLFLIPSVRIWVSRQAHRLKILLSCSSPASIFAFGCRFLLARYIGLCAGSRFCLPLKSFCLQNRSSVASRFFCVGFFLARPGFVVSGHGLAACDLYSYANFQPPVCIWSSPSLSGLSLLSGSFLSCYWSISRAGQCQVLFSVPFLRTRQGSRGSKHHRSRFSVFLSVSVGVSRARDLVPIERSKAESKTSKASSFSRGERTSLVFY
jgi:hypothetical protein